MSKGFPSKETVARVRETYPPGCRVELVSMDDPYTTLRPGDRGSVDHVDSTGTVFVAWDSGSHLGAVYGADSIKLCDEKRGRDMSLTEKIELAETCVRFNPRRSGTGNCDIQGYAPFDCYICTSYIKAPPVEAAGSD